MPRGNGACRVDANQKEIVAVWRKLGASVLMLHMVGHGCGDVLVGLNGINILVEIKDGSQVPSRQKLTPDEVEFHSSWKGQICVIRSIEDAIDLINCMRCPNPTQ